MKDYNVLLLPLHSDYVKPADLEDFLDEVLFGLGGKWFHYEQTNNTPEPDPNKTYNAYYVLVDYSKKINPDKLLKAFHDLMYNVSVKNHDKFIGKLVYRIKQSKEY